MKVTYAARGLLEWQMAINVGGAILRLLFTGGYMGINGVIPAKYTTENVAIQKIIEKSSQYKSKRIYIYSVEESDDEKNDKDSKK